MSRIGRKPITVPAGVKINTSGEKVEVQGPKGKLQVLVPRQIRLEQKDGVLTAIRDNEEHRALHGLARALLANVPRLEAKKQRFAPVAGEIPSPLDPPSGCHFHTRCPIARETCRSEPPQLHQSAAGHWVACHFRG